MSRPGARSRGLRLRAPVTSLPARRRVVTLIRSAPFPMRHCLRRCHAVFPGLEHAVDIVSRVVVGDLSRLGWSSPCGAPSGGLAGGGSAGQGRGVPCAQRLAVWPGLSAL
jgi:hypothetical protein